MKRLVLTTLLVATRAAAQPAAPQPAAAPPAAPQPAAPPPAAPQTVDEHLAKVRELYDKGDFAHARDELLAAYQLEPRPALLFALGQVELNLGQFAKAIAYYEQFIASDPGAEQAALAQQAIGAARARLTEKPPTALPPRPPPHRTWDLVDTSIAALGGATLVAGAGLLGYGYRLGDDRSGTLREYDHRLSRATDMQWIGAGCLAAGALAIGGALLRWRWHLVETELQPIAGPGTAGVAWGKRW
jgi:tetratricopeptide (TPR) repeat protein